MRWWNTQGTSRGGETDRAAVAPRYQVGDVLAVAANGAGIVVEVYDEKVHRRPVTFVSVALHDRTVDVATTSRSLARLDAVLGPGGVEAVLDQLRDRGGVELPRAWARCYAWCVERLGLPTESGPATSVPPTLGAAAVVRGLTDRREERPLAPGETLVLAVAREILESQLAAAMGIGISRAEALVEDALTAAR